MAGLRRLDAVLEPTKQAVLDMKASLDAAGIVHRTRRCGRRRVRRSTTPRSSRCATSRPAPASSSSRPAKLRALRDRISEAQLDDVILALDKAPHCRDCFRRGWRAALRAIEG
jgi:hypothetical protein